MPSDVKGSGKRLTGAFVRNVKKPGKYHDNQNTGLYLRVDESGRKSWVQRITINGKRREIGLSSYPFVSLAEARERAFENKKFILRGIDPIREKRRHANLMTFTEAVDLYLPIKFAELRNEKNKAQWRSTLDRYAIPIIGGICVANVSVQDVLKVLERIWLTKNDTADKLRGRLEAIFSWAIASSHRQMENPARWKGSLSELLPAPGMIRAQQHFAAVSQGDAGRWWNDLSKREGMSADALKFAALTACRSGEVRGMIWDEVNFETKAWTIPKERMKARGMHRVPLTDQMIDLLGALPHLEGSPYVFFAPKGGKLSDMALSSLMRRIHDADTAKGGKGYVDEESRSRAVPHGLRSTFSVWAAQQGYESDLAELALAHAVGSKVRRAYMRSDMMERRREMMEDWGRFLKKESSNANAL